MTDLPESLISEGLKLAEGATILGKKFADMTRDELIAVAAQGWTAEANARKDGMRTVEFLTSLHRSRR